MSDLDRMKRLRRDFHRQGYIQAAAVLGRAIDKQNGAKT